MKFLRVGPIGEERPVVMDAAGRTFDLTGLTPDIDGPFLAANGIEAVRAALASGSLPDTDVSGERIGAPIARPPAVLCVGMNYAAHAAESGANPPDNPVLFHKHPNTIVGPNDPIVIPRESVKTDWEVELGVVIGTRAGYLDSPEDAAAVIAGYVLSNDVSERAYQLEVSGGQWSKGKSCASFNPLGPWLVTPDEIGDAGRLRLTSRVNGEPRQDSGTADMIFDVPFLVWHLSQYLVLEPGDLLNTGTPEGVALSGRFPYLTAGDRVEISIEKLGSQSSVCVSAQAGRA